MSSLPLARAAADKRQRWANTIGYYLIFIAIGSMAVSIGPTLPALARHTGSTLEQISLLFTARAIGGLTGSFLLGRLYDRLPAHTLMLFFLSLIVICAILVPVIPVLWLLVLVMLIQGMAEGTMHVGCNTLIVWVHGANVGPFMNGMHFFFGLGAVISPIIVAQVMSHTGDVLWAYWILALLFLPTIINLRRLPSPAPPVSTDDTTSKSTNRFLVGLVALFLFLYVGLEISFNGWIFTYAITLKLGTETSAAYLNSAFWAAMMAGRLLAIPLARSFRPSRILLANLSGIILSAVLLLAGTHSITAVWAGAVGMGLAMASTFPMTIAMAQHRLTITGRTTSLFLVGASLGGMTLPWLVGQLFVPVGPHILPLLIFGGMVVNLGVLSALIKFSNKK